jgi:hypothetical protein
MINFFLKYSNQTLERKNLKKEVKYKSLKRKEVFSFLAIYVYSMVLPITNIKYFWKNTVMKQKIIVV